MTPSIHLRSFNSADKTGVPLPRTASHRCCSFTSLSFLHFSLNAFLSLAKFYRLRALEQLLLDAAVGGFASEVGGSSQPQNPLPGLKKRILRDLKEQQGLKRSKVDVVIWWSPSDEKRSSSVTISSSSANVACSLISLIEGSCPALPLGRREKSKVLHQDTSSCSYFRDLKEQHERKPREFGSTFVEAIPRV
ncbi:hypothetical protein L596_001794 [Steinernema carpocapsae]|uniref:Uncharacterized protein n=1 Tax=Steinernema carpocapsae TaxID=34508 RepID=A0A4U8UM99_STECR|nr:hypothetical protein L596_001794 [Steinernema carpocapsae]